MIIEFIGSPDAGKTTSIRALKECLESSGTTCELVLETRGKNIFPQSKRGTLEYNTLVGGITCGRIKEIVAKSSSDIILVDKGYADYLFFVDYYLESGKTSEAEAEQAKLLYSDFGIVPDILIMLTCIPEVAATRCEDAVETRTVKLQKSIDAVCKFYAKWNKTKKFMFDTSYMTVEEVVKVIAAII